MSNGTPLRCVPRYKQGTKMEKRSIDPRLVRQSVIAGTWYPESPSELSDTVDEFLARAQPTESPDRLIGLIAPHAGYPYSGQTAAYAHRQLRDQNFDLVIVIGPSHYQDFGAYAISAKRYYWTPLGNVELDQDFITNLTRQIPLTRVERDREHSLEIQLPFLQRTLQNFKLVPIMMSLPFYIVGADAFEPCQQLADALVGLAATRKILFVASSDLSHLSDYHAVKTKDAHFAELVEAFDIPGLANYMARDRECRACGDAPIITLLLAAKQLGADRARVFYRTNSGDVTGERELASYVVGYMAAGVYQSMS